jgi:predicted GH43/DUF377 family glycosyl hydrolase
VSPLRSPDRPLKAILREPLIKPNKDERDGYVPSLVYSRGSLPGGGQLIIPCRMSDYATAFAMAPLDEMLAALQ